MCPWWTASVTDSPYLVRWPGNPVIRGWTPDVAFLDLCVISQRKGTVGKDRMAPVPNSGEDKSMPVAAPRSLSVLGLALCLAVASAEAQTATEAPAAAVAEARPALAVELPATPVHVEEAARLKGLGKVAIAGFQVYVITEQSASSTAQGGSAHSTIASVATDLKVEGLTAERLKALTNSLYDDTVRQLQAQGLAVVPHEQLQAAPAFAALKAAGAADGLAIDTRGGKGQVFAARDLPVLHMNEMGWLHRGSGGLFGGPKVEDAYVSLGDTVSSGFKLGAFKPPLTELAKTVDAPLLQVRLVLTAAQLKGKGNGFFSSTAKTEAAGNLVLPAFTNRFLVMTPAGDFARVSLDQPLVSAVPLGPLKDVTSTGQTAANVAVTAFTMAAAAFGGGGRGVIQNHGSLQLQTDPDAFDALARPHAGAVLGALAKGLTDGS